MSDPYRTASTDACPACSAPLLAPGDDGVRACAQGCGEWAGATVVARLWGDALHAPEDYRLRWRGGKPFPCVTCSARTVRHMHERCTFYTCSAHGVWFHGDSRARFEELFAAPLAQHRAELAELAHLTQLLHGVRSGDAAAIDELARRWLRLARQVR